MSTRLRESEAVARLHAQYATVRALAECRSLEEAAPRILQAVGEPLGWEHAALWRVDPAAGVLRCFEIWHAPGVAFPELARQSLGTTFVPGIGLPGRVWKTGKPVWLPDVVADDNFPRGPAVYREGLRTALGFPILAGEDVLGVLEVFSREARPPDREMLEMLATIGSQIGQFTVRLRAEQELATLFEQSPDLLCIAGTDGYFRRVNPAWQRTLGYTPAELLGRPYVEFVHPDDRERTGSEAGRIATGSGAEQFENRYRCKDGSYRWLSWKSAPLPEEGLIYALARDVTEERRAAEELRRAREAADAANRAKGDFLANVSHEIRTPMNAVIGMAELLLDTPLLEVQREYLQTLKDAAESLLDLINDILDFAKMEAGKLELRPEEFDLRDALGDTLRTLGLRAHQKGLELACRIAPGVPQRLVGDPRRLRQVVVNLVGNAVKFTQQGEVLLEVAPVRQDARSVLLGFVVSDTGIGIPRQEQARIFEAFEQVDGSTTRRYGGTGLGLSISAQLVERMGGEISVDSQPGRGSRFRFTARFARASRHGRRTPPRGLRGLRVLVVDDNATNRRILEEVLRQWGMRPKCVGEARQALAEMERSARGRRAYPLVLLDAAMPGLDGFGLAERIRARPRLAGAAIMMLSSGAGAGDRERCLALGVASYLTKPVKQSDLMDAIATVILPAGAGGKARPAGKAAAAAKGRRLRVLLAEDNPVNQRVASGMLERLGHLPVTAANGREVLALLEREAFDLVLMDVQMPELDGLETTAAIRERERASGRHLPIVALTAHAMKGDAEKCLAAGMDGYLAKPLQAKELSAAIEAALAGVTPRLVEAVAPAPAAAIVDEATLLERVGGDRRALGQIVRVFRTDAPRQLVRIRSAVRAADAGALRAAAHALKGAVSNFAAARATEAALQLQRLGESGELDGAEEALRRLQGEMAELLSTLQSLVGQGSRARPARIRAGAEADAASTTRSRRRRSRSSGRRAR